VALVGLTYAYINFEPVSGLFGKNETKVQDQEVINILDKENILNGLSSDSQANKENTVEDRLKYLNTIQLQDKNTQPDDAIKLKEKRSILNSL
jgi:hypothetical protein